MPPTSEPRRILVLCTGNSARSVMTEAFLRHHGGERVHVASAGSRPQGIHPLTRQVMAEVGLALEGAHSKHLDQFLDEPWDVVLTVCDNAAAHCPSFPGPAERLHWPFDDPPAAPEGERLDAFRRVRDQIDTRVREWVERTLP